MGRVLGLDYGKKRIGIALSDLLGIAANPFDVIEHKSFKADARKILEIAKANDVSAIVTGLPVNMDGTEGEMAEFVRNFVFELEALAQENNIKVHTVDERLTTAQAERMLVDEMDVSRAKRKAVRDKIAAALILQIFLDSKG